MVTEKQDKYIKMLIEKVFSDNLISKYESLDYFTAILFGKKYENLSIREGIALIEILEQASSSLWKIGERK
ncbi:MAG: hypothetical protein QXJ28_00670 [Candidatus Pacearchaeota archaeon]